MKVTLFVSTSIQLYIIILYIAAVISASTGTKEPWPPDGACSSKVAQESCPRSEKTESRAPPLSDLMVAKVVTGKQG